MRKYLYTTLLLALLAQEGVMAQENEGKKGGFFGKIKDTFSTEIKIGNYTFKDGSVYTGEMKGRKPNGKGKTVFKNGDVFEGEYVKGKREGYVFIITVTTVCGIRIISMVKEQCIIITVICM